MVSRVLAIAAALSLSIAVATSLGSSVATADAMERRHALTLIDRVEYPADFKHFKWVNPSAPKAGRLRYAIEGSFDTLNGYSVKGDPAPALSMMDATLMTQSLDEAGTSYCQVAEWVAHSDDLATVVFGLRPEARFSDGRPITPEDVVFSFEGVKRVSPLYNQYFKNVISAEKTGDHEVTFKADIKNNRELPIILGDLPVLAKHWWTAIGADGEKRDLDKTTLEPPVVSGPYKVGKVDPGRSITYQRVKEHWGEKLALNVGQWNFNEIQFEMFHNATAMFESFKSGGLDFFLERSAKQWATAYRFPAADKGLVKREELPVKGAKRVQAVVLNQRRMQFRDRRLREALGLAFNFEWLNRNVLFNFEERTASYFPNTELAATGLPQGLELAVLQRVKAQLEAQSDSSATSAAKTIRLLDHLPAEIFSKPVAMPVNANETQERENLRRAAQLLQLAGYELKAGLAISKTTGTPLTFEFLIEDHSLERTVIAYQQWLGRLGIGTSIRLVDSAQYRRRLSSFDYDVFITTGNLLAQSESPGNEQRDFWSSAAAGKDGSSNYAGIKNAAIDLLIEWLVLAQTREDVVALTRAIDRILIWQHYMIPTWHGPRERIAYWKKFGRPERMPMRSIGPRQVWWYDAAAEARLRGPVSP